MYIDMYDSSFKKLRPLLLISIRATKKTAAKAIISNELRVSLALTGKKLRPLASRMYTAAKNSRSKLS